MIAGRLLFAAQQIRSNFFSARASLVVRRDERALAGAVLRSELGGLVVAPPDGGLHVHGAPLAARRARARAAVLAAGGLVDCVRAAPLLHRRLAGAGGPHLPVHP